MKLSESLIVYQGLSGWQVQSPSTTAASIVGTYMLEEFEDILIPTDKIRKYI